MIVVTGGNGQLGRHIVAALAELIGPGFIVTVRDPAKAADLAAQGLTVRAGDFDKPVELAHAFDGADTLLLMATVSPQDVRIAQYRNAVDAAKRCGVGRIAFVGYLADQPDSPFPSAISIHQALGYMREQGYRPINLRNGNYAEAGLQTAQRALATGRLAIPAGNGRISAVTRRDLARATARILAEPGQEGAEYALSGPSAYDYAELAAMLSEVAGRRIAYEDITPEQYRAELVAAGTPEGFIGFMMASAATTKGGYLAEVSDTIERLTGIAPEDGLGYIRRELTR